MTSQNETVIKNATKYWNIGVYMLFKFKASLFRVGSLKLDEVLYFKFQLRPERFIKNLIQMTFQNL